MAHPSCCSAIQGAGEAVMGAGVGKIPTVLVRRCGFFVESFLGVVGRRRRHVGTASSFLLVCDANSGVCYYVGVIRSCRDTDTRAVAERGRVRRLPEDIQR